MIEAKRRRASVGLVKRFREASAAFACLLVSGMCLGCHPTPDVAVDHTTNSGRPLPKNVDPRITEQVGRKALAEIGYIPIMKLAQEAGWVKTIRRKTAFRGDPALFAQAADVTEFAKVFSKYAVAAGVASQADSPLPGPGDVAAIGIIVLGLIDAGLLAGAILNSITGASTSTSTTTSSPPIATTMPMATTMPTVYVPPIATTRPKPDLDKDEECYERCKHLLPSPSGDLQASEYRKCYRECKGTL